MTREAETRRSRDRAADARRGARARRAAAAPRSDVGFATSRSRRRATPTTRQKFRKMLREGALDDREIEIEVARDAVGVEIMAPPGMEDMTQQLQGMFQQLGGGRTQAAQDEGRARRCKLLTDEEAGEADQRRRAASRGRSPTPSRTASCSSTRSTRSRAAQRNARRRRVARGRAARPAAAGRRHDGEHEVRHGARPITSCSSRRARSTCRSRRT